MSRTKLPSRRSHVISEIKYGNLRYHVSAGTDYDGKVLGVFVSSVKRSNDADDIARDFGLVMSLALQNGCTLSDISKSLGDATFAGAVIQQIEKMTEET